MNRSHYQNLFAFGALFGFLPIAVASVAAASESDRSALEQEVRTASTQYLSALRSGDAEAVAASWTADGVYVDASGQTFPAQALVQDEFGDESSAEDLPLEALDDTTIRFVTNAVAIERAAVREDQVKDRRVDFLAIWKKSDDRWKLDYVQEFAAGEPTSPTALESLNWMVGQWQADHDGIRANLSVNWSADRNYLEQQFTVRLPDQPALVGEQRLAWDPAEQRIRSWLFRSDGGFGEGTWQQSGDVWISKTVGTMPDGTKTKSINVWSSESADRCLFKSHRPAVNGEGIDDVLLEFTRVASPRSQ